MSSGAIQLWEGVILIREGVIATDPNCCCDAGPGPGPVGPCLDCTVNCWVLRFEYGWFNYWAPEDCQGCQSCDSFNYQEFTIPAYPDLINGECYWIFGYDNPWGDATACYEMCQMLPCYDQFWLIAKLVFADPDWWIYVAWGLEGFSFITGWEHENDEADAAWRFNLGPDLDCLTLGEVGPLEYYLPSTELEVCEGSAVTAYIAPHTYQGVCSTPPYTCAICDDSYECFPDRFGITINGTMNPDSCANGCWYEGGPHIVDFIGTFKGNEEPGGWTGIDSRRYFCVWELDSGAIPAAYCGEQYLRLVLSAYAVHGGEPYAMTKISIITSESPFDPCLPYGGLVLFEGRMHKWEPPCEEGDEMQQPWDCAQWGYPWTGGNDQAGTSCAHRGADPPLASDVCASISREPVSCTLVEPCNTKNNGSGTQYPGNWPDCGIDATCTVEPIFTNPDKCLDSTPPEQFCCPGEPNQNPPWPWDCT